MRFLVVFLLWLSTIAAAFPVGSHVVHEKREADPIGWDRDSRASRDAVLAVRIGLKQQNLKHGELALQDMHNRTSHNFRKRWTAERVHSTFAPHPTTTNATLDWLHAAGVEDSRITFSARRDWIMFLATVGEAEDLFHTKYYDFLEKESGGLRMACDNYKLPQHVREHVDYITPTIQLDGLRPMAHVQTETKSIATADHITAHGGADDLSTCHIFFTVQCFRALYNVPVASHNNTGNELGILGLGNYLYMPDFKEYLRNWTSPRIPLDVEPESVYIYGGKPGDLSLAEAGKTGETALDVQVSSSIIYPQKVRFYQIGQSKWISGFDLFLDALDPAYSTSPGGIEQYLGPGTPEYDEGEGTKNIPRGGAPLSHVISISYGITENQFSRSSLERTCHEYMKLGLQGVTIVASAGDDGAGSSDSQFAPQFPCTCPHVLCVGATTLQDGTIAGGEMAATFSGSGFSNVFPRPSYQDDAVSGWLSNSAPAYGEGRYNRSGRAYPDVAVIGVNYPVVTLNTTEPVSGTSASAPAFASMINNINEERLAAGKDPVGTLNWDIYDNPEIFNDIVVRHNPEGGMDGFPAGPGWDAASGFGSLQYDKLRELLLSDL